jgi:glycosyltransferase involved in cell wall biosynthesis
LPLQLIPANATEKYILLKNNLMYKYTFSVIVPTFNRFEKLVKVLQSLENQSFSKQAFEVIVINDGSTQPEYKNTISLKNNYSFELVYLIQNNKGAAAARNMGIDNANGQYIIFLGDDTYASIDLLSEHLRSHKNAGAEISALGFVDWDKNLKLNSLMRFISPAGPQFDFRIKNITDVGYRRFYTSNISVPAHILKTEKFNEGFPGCNLEDIELGYRLEKLGHKIHYNQKAVVYHDHFYADINSYTKRQESAGRNKRILLNLHPELNNLWSNHSFLKLILIKDAAIILFASIFNRKKNFYLRAIFEKAQIKAFLKTRKA